MTEVFLRLHTTTTYRFGCHQFVFWRWRHVSTRCSILPMIMPIVVRVGTKLLILVQHVPVRTRRLNEVHM